MKTSIVVPVFNNYILTNQFLKTHFSLYGQNNDVELIIVNNNSTDNTHDILKYWQHRLGNKLKVLTLKENKGFSAGNNIGFKEATGELIIFTSNDVLFNGEYISLIKEAVIENKDGLFGPQLITFNTGWNRFNNGSETFTISYLGGWFVAATKETFNKIGLWDERYFPCDYEDIDLSYKAKQLGISLNEVPLPAHHSFGQTAGKLFEREKITLNSQKVFCEKWELSII